MANLDNKRIKDTYEGLIKTNDNNAISSEVELTDGAGNGTGVSVSTDGRVVASGTVSFGSLKDTGENITITKFVDEADGIASNDNDTTIPTTAAVKDYVDSTEVNSVTSVNTQTGAVVLGTDNIAEGSSNLYYTESRVSANSSVAANTAKNTYPSADATKVGHITVTQAVDLDTLESNVATNNAKTGITSQQAADITTNNAKVGITTSQANAITANTAKISFDSTSSSKLSGIEANADVTDVANVTTALNSISVKELSDISTSSPSNNQVLQFKTSSNKFEPTTLTSTAPVDSVNSQTGVVVLDTDDIAEGSSNLYFTDVRVAANSAVAANTAKTGITTSQANAITANTAKVGITTDQANAITANTAKNSYPSGDATKVGHLTVTQAVDLDTMESDIATNNAKVGISTSQANAIIANTAKNSYPSGDSTKVGHISVTQAVDLDTMESNIATNNAKISFDSTSSSKLAGIETGADVTDAANVTAAGALMDSEIDADIKTLSLPANTTISTFAKTILDDADASAVRTTIGAGTSDLALGTSSSTALAGDTTTISGSQASAITANTAKNSYPSADSAKVGFISVTQAVDLDTLESDVATNNAKVGITTTQANNITANNAKISFDSTSSTKLGTIEENADVTDTANVTAAGALMDSEVDADIKTLSLPASTTISTFAKTFLDDADAAAVRTTIGAGTSSLVLGTSAGTALEGDTTIPTNNNQLSNGAGYTTNTGTVTEVTVGTGLDVSSGTSTPAISLDLTEISVGTGLDTSATGISLDLSEFTDMTADMETTDEFIVLDSSSERRKAVNEIKSTLFSNNDLYKVIGVATDHSSRVLSDSGTSEGATSIMQNFEILIAN
tara:strand:- start:1438 stop:4002 length:2565 start_codon:yes stop_codon:yes gene_type:complete